MYAGLGAGLRAAAQGLDRLAATGAGPRLEDGPRGRFVNSAVNGLIGDRLLAGAAAAGHPDGGPRRRPRRGAGPTRPGRSVPGGRPVGWWCSCTASARTSPTGTGIATAPARRTARRSRRRGWTPVFLRANTGLGLRENGVALAALMQRVVEAWPVPVDPDRPGRPLAWAALIMRAAGAVAAEPPASGSDWNDLVTDVVTLGTPHLGAPIAWGIGHGSRGLGRLPETAAFGRILD